jgi:hypothetical protein
MKKQLRYIAAVFTMISLFTACSKKDDDKTPVPTYPSTQGVVTGTGSATFNTSGTNSVFTKVADTVMITALIDQTTPNGNKRFILAFQTPTLGTHNFDDLYDHITDNNYYATSGAIHIYFDINSAGTIIAHQFAVKSGTYTITSLSSTGIAGTYHAVMHDYNNNGDAPETISGSFSGSF